MSESTDVKLRFHLKNLDPGADEDAVRRSFDEAMQAAIEEAGGESRIKPKAEFVGGFLGAGETVVVLWILHALKVGGVAFGTGAVTAAGKSFYEDFLAPQLRKRNFERQHGHFMRSYPLPQTVDAKIVNVEVRNGVLEVILRKDAAVRAVTASVSGESDFHTSAER